MEVSINILWIVGIIVAAIVMGYFIGRQERQMLQRERNAEECGDQWETLTQETMTQRNLSRRSGTQEIMAQQDPAQKEASQTEIYQEKEAGNERRRRGSGHRIVQGTALASPTAGQVHFFCEGGKRGAVIEPEQGTVYAPVSGKIVRLYPMGNAFILRAEDGMELLIRVGRQHPDELCSMYFRSRIVQNEIVNKGKLLLTFDRELLQEAGEEVAVTVCPEEGITAKEISVTQKDRVKVGEDLLWIRKCST